MRTATRILAAAALSLCALLTSCASYNVFSMRDNPSVKVGGGILYALPKTEVCVAVTLERRDLSNAPFSAFAADFIGVDNIDTNIHIVDIDVYGNNVADDDNYFYVKVRRGSITVDQRHLLLAIGTDASAAYNASATNTDAPTANREQPPSPRSRAGYNLYDRADTLYCRYDPPGHPSSVSTRKDVRSLRQRALAASERLEELQEKQRELLNGEYEGSYGGTSVQYLYERLQRQEADIVASFCGVTRRETVIFRIDPVMRKKEDFLDTVAWFSPSEGLMASADQLPDDASPIVCTILNDNELRSVNRFVRYHTSGLTSNGASGRSGNAAAKYRNRRTFRYRIPVQTSVSVTSPYFYVSKQIALSQLGPVVELPKRRISARFNPQTLDLIELIRK